VKKGESRHDHGPALSGLSSSLAHQLAAYASKSVAGWGGEEVPLQKGGKKKSVLGSHGGLARLAEKVTTRVGKDTRKTDKNRAVRAEGVAARLRARELDSGAAIQAWERRTSMSRWVRD